MATNPIPPDSENLTVNLPRGIKARLKEQAERSRVSLSDYVRGLINRAIAEGTIIQVRHEITYHTNPFAPTKVPPEPIHLGAVSESQQAPYHSSSPQKKEGGRGRPAPTIPKTG